jgi:hypothetical protein
VLCQTKEAKEKAQEKLALGLKSAFDSFSLSFCGWGAKIRFASRKSRLDKQTYLTDRFIALHLVPPPNPGVKLFNCRFSGGSLLKGRGIIDN